MGHAAGGRPAERLLRRLGIRVSDDTVIRQLLRATLDNAPPARVSGTRAERGYLQYPSIADFLEAKTALMIAPIDEDTAKPV